MKTFVLKKINKKIVIDNVLDKMNGFKYIPKLKNYKIKEITILNQEIIDKLIIRSFDKKYKKILEAYLKILSEMDSDSTDGLLLILDEVTRLRNIIIRKYRQVLSKQSIAKLLQKLKIIENELRSKIIDYKLMNEQEKVKGR